MTGKRPHIVPLIFFLMVPGIILITSLISCERIEPVAILKVRTDSINSVSPNAFTITGRIVFIGESAVSQHGFCYSQTQNPSLENGTKNELGNKLSAGSFQDSFTGLNPNTTYYARAYATDRSGVVYGDVKKFATPSPGLPTLATTAISNVTQETAQSGGTILDDGGSAITAKGVCWDKSVNPTIALSHTTDGSGSETFTSYINGLSCGTTYYLRAYATNSTGTSYGDQLNFTSGDCPANLATVITSSASDITDTSATVGGSVTDDGGATVTESGIYWGTSTSPHSTGTKLPIGSGTGGFSTVLTGLTFSTTYYVVSYAVNSSGEAIGDEKSFTTLDQPSMLIETEGDINDSLLSCYSRLHRYVEHTYLFDAIYSNHIAAPDGSWTDIYDHNQTQTSNNEKILTLWTDAYKIIYSVNLILESSSIILSEIDRQSVTAQAKGIRAYLFYNLMTWFGGIPLETGYTESMSPRNTVAEVLAQIDADATEAGLSLPEKWTATDKFRIPGSFTKALLARNSLYGQDYAKTQTLIAQIINSGEYDLSLDYDNFTFSNSEIFWGFAKKDNTEFNYFFTKGTYVPVIRLTETYLISSAALYNMGDNAGALSYFNALKTRRGEAPLASLTTDDLFQTWNTELAKEGTMFSTLKRFNKALSVVGSSHKLLLPIPLTALLNNPSLVQNPGY